MAWVKREGGRIVGAYAGRHPGAAESMPEDHPELLAFRERQANPQRKKEYDVERWASILASLAVVASCMFAVWQGGRFVGRIEEKLDAIVVRLDDQEGRIRTLERIE